MPGWKDKLNGDPVPWLLENDKTQPAIRYYALRDVLGRGENDSEVKAAKAAIMTSGPVLVILAAQQPEGYWDNAGDIPKHTVTQWALRYLAQFGADGDDARVRAGCEYLLSQYIESNAGLSHTGTRSGFSCGVAGMAAALIELGWLGDPRLQTAMEWLAQSITGEGVADASDRDANNRHDKSVKRPPFACSGANANLPCAWGAIKAMAALSKIPPARRTRNMQEAIKLGMDFLLSRDPAVADYPSGWGNSPSPIWFKFTYPLDSYCDVLQDLEVLAALGQAGNPKLANALDLVIGRQNQHGRWLLERTYKELTYAGRSRSIQAYRRSYLSTIKDWVDIEKKGQPSKWVTLRALRVLKAAYPETG